MRLEPAVPGIMAHGSGEEVAERGFVARGLAEAVVGIQHAVEKLDVVFVDEVVEDRVGGVGAFGQIAFGVAEAGLLGERGSVAAVRLLEKQDIKTCRVVL